MLVIFVVSILILSIIWLRFKLSYWERKGVPGPKPWPFVGNTGAHVLGRKYVGNIFHEIYKEYESYPFVGIFRGSTPVLLIRDPDLVSHVLVKDFKSFRNNDFLVDKNSAPLLYKNPFVLRDEEWKETRQMLTPGLTSGKLKNVFSNFKNIAENFVKFVENHPTVSTDGIETRALTKRLTLDNVAKAVFGIDGKSFESYDDISEFNKVVDYFLGTGANLVLLLTQLLPFLSKIFTLKLVPDDVEEKLVRIISEVVEYRRKNNACGSDFLQFLMELAKEKNFSDADITGHATTFLLDGYETSSQVLSFLLLNMAQNPEYQEKVREDIRKYERENNGDLSYESVHEMPWLNACLYESIRLTPPVDVLTKECSENFEYTPNNPDLKSITVKLAPGDIVLVPYGLFSHDEKYFENAGQFIPERMLKKDSFDKSIFFPFGDGPRACIGQRLGIMQVKLGAAYILKHFQLSVSPKLKQPMKFVPYHLMKEAQGGIWIKYHKI